MGRKWPAAELGGDSVGHVRVFEVPQALQHTLEEKVPDPGISAGMGSRHRHQRRNVANTPQR